MNPYTQFVYNSSAGSASTEATPRSSADTAGGDNNVFSDWLLLMQEITYSPRGPVTITFVQNETLPVGDWDLADVTLRGNGEGQTNGTPAPATQVEVTIPTGCTFSSWRYGQVEAGLRLKSTSTAPVLVVDEALVIQLEYGFIECTTAPFFSLTSDAVFALSIRGGGGMIDGGYEVIDAASGGPTVVVNIAGESAWADNDTIRGTAALYGQLVTHPAADPAIFPTNANLTAGYDFSALKALAAHTGYTPAVTGDWTGADPTTVAGALDRIAAAITPVG